jgi:hypothetical protein
MRAKILNEKRLIAPKVVFDHKAYEWIRAIVDMHEDEVGFYAFVDQRANNIFFIRDVYYPKHDMTNDATCEISPDGQIDILVQLYKAGKEDDAINLKVWGHSHVNMGIKGSSQDHNQAIKMVEENSSYVVRIIVNKRMDVGISIYDYSNNMIFDDVCYEIDLTDLEAIGKSKIAKIKNIIDSDDALKQITDIINENCHYNEAVEHINQNKAKNIPNPQVEFNQIMASQERFPWIIRDNWK